MWKSCSKTIILVLYFMHIRINSKYFIYCLSAGKTVANLNVGLICICTGTEAFKQSVNFPVA